MIPLLVSGSSSCDVVFVRRVQTNAGLTSIPAPARTIGVRGMLSMRSMIAWFILLLAFFAFLPATVTSFLSALVDPRHHGAVHVKDVAPGRSALVAVSMRLASSSSSSSSSSPDDVVRQHDDGELAATIRRLRSNWESIDPNDLPKYLVQRGMARLQRERMNNNNNNDTVNNGMMQNPHRVPGCIATVDVEPILRSSWPEGTKNDDDDDDDDHHHHHHHHDPDQSPYPPVIVERLVGTADAHVSRGLLDIVAELVRGLDLTRSDIRTVTAADLRLDTALSPGRTNGLTSMLATIYEVAMLQTNGRKTAFVPPPPPPTAGTTTSNAVLPRVPTANENETKTRPSVALLLSGGVDSSVALHLLLQQNYNVTAYYLKIWLEDELAHLSQCPWEDDVHMCQQVCDQANVRFETLSLQEAYHERVIQHTLQEARMGRTPNPDILCNSLIKFGVFWDQIEPLCYDYIATGHYAQIVRCRHDDDNDNNGHDNDDGNIIAQIQRAPDPVKDQSYFLCRLTQAQLQRVLFPIGHLEKIRVRQLADQLQLPNRHRPDSQGLCFLGKVKFEDFLSSYLPNSTGQVVDALTGDVIGEHRGLHFHTVGQRRGMGKVLYPKSTSSGPWYVVAKDIAQNVLYCTNRYDDATWDESRCDVTLENVHWQNPRWRFTPGWYDVKIRHGPTLARGHLSYFVGSTDAMINDNGDDGSGNENASSNDDQDDTTLFLHLDAKDKGLAPGQSAVIYTDDGICLGGGIISERHWNVFLKNRHPHEQPREA